MPVRGLNDWPMEIVERVLDYCLLTEPVSLLACNRQVYAFLIPRIYTDVRIKSLDQLSRFVSVRSASRWWCPKLTESLFIEIPGLPGSSDLDDDNSHDGASWIYFPRPPGRPVPLQGPASRTSRRMLAVNEALGICLYIKHLELALFTVRHGFTDKHYERNLHSDTERAFSLLTALGSITWRTPGASGSIQGISIALDAVTATSVLNGLLRAGSYRLKGTIPIYTTILPDGEFGTADVEGPYTVGPSPILFSDLAIHDRRSIVRKQAQDCREHPLKVIRLSNVEFGKTDLRALARLSVSSAQHIDASWDRIVDQDAFTPLLLPQLQAIDIASAVNLSPTSIAHVLFSFKDKPRAPQINLTDTFVASVWERRLSHKMVAQAFPSVLEEAGRWLITSAQEVDIWRHSRTRCLCSWDHWPHARVRSCDLGEKAMQLLADLGKDHRPLLLGAVLRSSDVSKIWPWITDIWRVEIPLFLRGIVSYNRARQYDGCPSEAAALESMTAYRDHLRRNSSSSRNPPEQETLRFADWEALLTTLRGLVHQIEATLSGMPRGDNLPGESLWRASNRSAHPRNASQSLGLYLNEQILDECKPLLSKLKLSRVEGAIGGGHTRDESDDDDEAIPQDFIPQNVDGSLSDEEWGGGYD